MRGHDCARVSDGMRGMWQYTDWAAANDHQPYQKIIYTWLGTDTGHLNYQKSDGTMASLQADAGFLLDPLSSIWLLFVTGVGMLIHIYSTGYMAHEGGYYRFFGYLNLFMFSMLTLILANNYVLMFVGWEGVGLCSYLLIGFYFHRKSASDAANKAFIVNRIGDAGFILGMFFIAWMCGSLRFIDVTGFRARARCHIAGKSLHHGGDVASFVGACGKSAQLPLYVWLPDAMEGPTPVSALIHAATMVTAGVYMVARSNALFVLAPSSMMVVAIVGAMTAIFAASIGLVQNDIKRVLAYSTVSQLGYMFLALGVGAFSAGVFHVFTHAFFKALLFLGAGSVIHAMSGEQDMRNMGGLAGKIPVTYRTMFVATSNTMLEEVVRIAPVWIGAQTDFFVPGAGIFTPQSFFGAAPFNAPPFGPGTPVEFLFLQPRSYFGQQIPSRTLPFTTGLFEGPAAATFADSTNLAFLHKLAGVYVQDQWKPTTNLTLTLGLRYESIFSRRPLPSGSTGGCTPQTMETCSHARDWPIPSGREKGDPRRIRPVYRTFRLQRRHGVVAGGVGFHLYEPADPARFANPSRSLVGLGPSGIVGVNGPVLASPAFSTFTHTGVYPRPSALLQFPLGYAPRKFPNAYAEQANFEIENEVAKGLFVTAGYQFVHALKMPSYLSINGVPSGTTASGVQAFATADPNFGFTLMASPSAFSIYHAGTLSVRKPFAHHYSILGNYTFSKSIDLATDVQLTDSPMDYLNPQLDRALGDNDVRHRLVLTMLGESPGSWNPALRNFKVAILNTLQSPRYYSVFAGFDVNGDGFPFSDRVGTLGRNTYRGDPSYTTEFVLSESFDWASALKAEASAEVFNLFNRPNVNGIDTVYGSAFS